VIKAHSEDKERKAHPRAVAGFISRLFSFTESICSGGEDELGEIIIEGRLCVTGKHLLLSSALRVYDKLIVRLIQ